MEAAVALFQEPVPGSSSSAEPATIGVALHGNYDSRRVASRYLARRVSESLMEDETIVDYVIEILIGEYINWSREVVGSRTSWERRIKGGIVALAAVLIQVLTRFGPRNVTDIVRNIFLVRMRGEEYVRWYACEGLYNILRTLTVEQTADMISSGLLEEIVETILDLSLKGKNEGTRSKGTNEGTIRSKDNTPINGNDNNESNPHVPLEVLNQLVLEKLMSERTIRWSGTWKRCSQMARAAFERRGTVSESRLPIDWMLSLVQNYQDDDGQNRADVADLIEKLLRLMEANAIPTSTGNPMVDDSYGGISSGSIHLLHRIDSCMTDFYQKLGKFISKSQQGKISAMSQDEHSHETFVGLLISRLLHMLVYRPDIRSRCIITSIDEDCHIKWSPAKAISWNMLWKLLQIKSAQAKWCNKQRYSGGAIVNNDLRDGKFHCFPGLEKEVFIDILGTLFSLVTGLAMEIAATRNGATHRDIGGVRDLAGFMDIFYEMHQFLLEDLPLHGSIETAVDRDTFLATNEDVFYVLLKQCEESAGSFVTNMQKVSQEYSFVHPRSSISPDQVLVAVLCVILRHGIALRMVFEWLVARLHRFGMFSLTTNSDSRERFLKILNTVLYGIHEFNQFHECYEHHSRFDQGTTTTSTRANKYHDVLRHDLVLLQKTVDVILENLMVVIVNTCFGSHHQGNNNTSNTVASPMASPLSNCSPMSGLSSTCPDSSLNSLKLIDVIIELSRSQVDFHYSHGGVRLAKPFEQVFWNVLYEVVVNRTNLGGIGSMLSDANRKDAFLGIHSQLLLHSGEIRQESAKFDAFFNFAGWLMINEPVDSEKFGKCFDSDTLRRLTRLFSLHAGPCVNLGFALFILRDYVCADKLLKQVYFPLFQIETSTGSRGCSHASVDATATANSEEKASDEVVEGNDDDPYDDELHYVYARASLKPILGTEVSSDYFLHEMHKVAYLLEKNRRVACDLLDGTGPLISLFQTLLMVLPQFTDSRSVALSRPMSAFALLSKRLLGATHGQSV